MLGDYNYACLGMNDYGDVVDEVRSSNLKDKWKKFALSLRIDPAKTNQIDCDNPRQCEECLYKILECWIKGESYDYEVCL